MRNLLILQAGLGLVVHTAQPGNPEFLASGFCGTNFSLKRSLCFAYSGPLLTGRLLARLLNRFQGSFTRKMSHSRNRSSAAPY